jgi:hypothetical protein
MKKIDWSGVDWLFSLKKIFESLSVVFFGGLFVCLYVAGLHYMVVSAGYVEYGAMMIKVFAWYCVSCFGWAIVALLKTHRDKKTFDKSNLKIGENR